MKKGQLAFENIILVGTVAFFAIFLIIATFDFFGLFYKASRIQDAIEDILHVASSVSNLGEGSQRFVTIYLPDGITGTVVMPHMIVVNFTVQGQSTVATGATQLMLVGKFPTTKGYHNVLVYAVDKDVILIGDAPYLTGLMPSSVNFTELPIIIEINGVNFDPDSIVIVDGEPYSAGFYNYINSRRIVLEAIPGHFPSRPKGHDYPFSVINPDGQTSNQLNFTVRGVGRDNHGDEQA